VYVKKCEDIELERPIIYRICCLFILVYV